jgi:hypothetical protein
MGPSMGAVVLYAATAALCLWAVARIWNALDTSMRMATALLLTVLIAPHLYVYDLVLLAPVLVALVAWTETRTPGQARRRVRWLVWMAWLAPLAGPIAMATRVQPSTIVLGLLLGVVSLAVVSDSQTRVAVTTVEA